jgi:hypothetical protein
VLSPGYWKTWQNVLSTNLKTMGSTYAYSMYTPY